MRVPSARWSVLGTLLTMTMVAVGAAASAPSVVRARPVASTVGVLQGAGVDFNGDGRSDYAVISKADNGQYTWQIEYSSGGSLAVPWGTAASQDFPTVGDFDGDGKTDPAVVREPVNGAYTWLIKYSKGRTGAISWGESASEDAPVSGDFDGDGRTDPAVVRVVPGSWDDVWLIHYSTGGTAAITWGNDTDNDLPVTGDFDGDGRTDLAVVRRNDVTGVDTWIVRDSSTGATVSVPWGNDSLGDQPIAGDFDGDGRTDFAVIRANTTPSGTTMTWRIKYSSGRPATYTQWGDYALGDSPVTGDFDGDGRTDYAVARAGIDLRGRYTWIIRNSRRATTTSIPWGPVGSSYPIPDEF